ncbi:NAD-dependent epimerase/dehydratase family protein [Pseudarthrobacter sp. J75]|uniref:NAD-dependent epimerase/dehydratase family protein n=1 Tax=unclassified Pseudarthrobacter TaxID=2647000 RepID=UPI002E80DD13|nr:MULTISPECIES: NAD-dependent epimerase/dehydratase family protein [unclassified Pseudarthrobacter]MEE2521395.1 NAD-dependent epimerase/dehydratase family protein [Pseudarthrobacter sp. J47]MEE2528627.1 NAD-dependent epimerase/dehydratase family protein [Pseudarthrobacter sp. J75]MEE2568318.1 NAD-dependent epimerase/dehydratase family protein [Pseudarthrobacter sp. J64]
MTTPAQTGQPAGTVLVTGGAGFIGCAISDDLVTNFDRVVVVDNLHPQIHSSGDRPAELAESAELIVADITDPATWDRVLGEVTPDVVIHLAAETGTGQSLEEATRHAHVNVVGTTQLLDGLNRHGKLPRRIVLSSSRAVYGEGAWSDQDGNLFYPGQRTSETLDQSQWDFPNATPTAMKASETSPAPVSVYGATKLAQEHILQAWAKSFGVETVILRLQNVYGPGQSLINPYTGIMSLFCRMAMGGKSIPLYEDGEVRRDFVLIDDVASAIVAGALSPTVQGEAMDIGSGEFQTIGTAAQLISKHYGAPEPHVTGQYRQGDVRHAWADVTAAQETLGWTPRFNLAQGIERLATWIDAQPDVKPY